MNEIMWAPSKGNGHVDREPTMRALPHPAYMHTCQVYVQEQIG